MEQYEQGLMDYETYTSKANEYMGSLNMKAWEDYYGGVKEYVDALKEYGIEVPEAYRSEEHT